MEGLLGTALSPGDTQEISPVLRHGSQLGRQSALTVAQAFLSACKDTGLGLKIHAIVQIIPDAGNTEPYYGGCIVISRVIIIPVCYSASI